MFIKFFDERYNKYKLVSLGSTEVLSYVKNVLSINDGSPATRYDTEEEGKARFDDIVDAVNSKSVVVYDLTKKVGYWKPKHTHKQRAAPKADPKVESK